MTDQAPNKASSFGHPLSNADYLDTHYLACQREYEATLRSAGLKTGWHVLDAGCGGGSFLPLMGELVGKNGKISALDLAPENANAVLSLVETGKIPCDVETRIGSITELPYADNQFDALWSANVTQYLTDLELRSAIAEFRRVVRTGGLVAIKDSDLSGSSCPASNPMLLWHLLEARQRANDTHIIGAFRGTVLPIWLRDAGLKDVWRQTTVVERWSPLRPIERSYIGDQLRWFASIAKKEDIPAEDKLAWQLIAETTDQLMNHTDFCYREMYVLAVGQVP